MRRKIKVVVERGLVACGAAGFANRRHLRDTRLIAYHNVVPDNEVRIGDVSLHTRESDFRRQVELLARTYEIVPLETILSTRADAPPPNRPRLSVTFDDAYVGAVTIGVDWLARQGIPATIFVAPGRLGRQSFWWDCIAFPGEEGSGVPLALRAEALTTYGGDENRVRTWAALQGWTARDLPETMLSATEGELVAAMSRHDGLQLASHSWSHANLASLDAETLQQELLLPREWLARFRRASTHLIAYPYGLWSRQVAIAARGAGYEAGIRVEGGWISMPLTKPYAVPRINIPAGISLDGFALRVAGVR